MNPAPGFSPYTSVVYINFTVTNFAQAGYECVTAESAMVNPISSGAYVRTLEMDIIDPQSLMPAQTNVYQINTQIMVDPEDGFKFTFSYSQIANHNMLLTAHIYEIVEHGNSLEKKSSQYIQLTEPETSQDYIVSEQNENTENILIIFGKLHWIDPMANSGDVCLSDWDLYPS